jgi:signal transduction histidine kinase
VLVAIAERATREQVLAAIAGYVSPSAVRLEEDLDDLTAVLAEQQPELVIVDAALPGYRPDTVELLRETQGGEGLCVVVLAGAAQLGELLAKAKYCADDLLVVPLQPVELQARIHLAFGRVQARHQRRVQARQLEDLTHRQREFLSVVSHEIRTPLSAIMSSANILRRYGRERPDSVEKFSTVIQQEGRRLTRLINNLLDLAKIEAGEVEWRLLPTPLGEVLDLLRDSFAAVVGERRLELAVEAPGAPGDVVLDRDKIIQVLVNLLSNAVKHSPEGSTVTLRCLLPDAGGLRFEVEDQGPGIPAGDEERIFERFQQLDGVEDRTGTGLGLTISREIVERHGGRIWVEAGRLGGALFAVELPAAPLAGEAHGSV